jgi:membrane protease YdiL (CAAX protease family)
MKKGALCLVEVLGFTLLLQAIGATLFGLPGNNIVAQLGAWLLFGLAVLLLAWIFNKLQRRQGLRELGFRCHKSFWADIWLGLCGFALLDILSLPFDLVAVPERSNMAHAIIEQLHFSSPAQILIGGSAFAVVLGFITGAFHEEIRFRGYYQGAGSAELTPLAGFIIALIPFSLGHYFAQPNWSLVQVLATIIGGIVYGLLYHATGSLVVVMTTHTVTNWLPFFPFLLNEVTGSRTVTLVSVVTLSVLSLVLIVLRWNRELREWRQATHRLFAERPAFGIVAGLIVGLALLATWPYRLPVIYSGLVGASLLGIPLLGKRAVRKPEANQL